MWEFFDIFGVRTEAVGWDEEGWLRGDEGSVVLYSKSGLRSGSDGKRGSATG